MNLKWFKMFRSAVRAACFLALVSCNSSNENDTEVGSGSAKNIVGGIIMEKQNPNIIPIPKIIWYKP